MVEDNTDWLSEAMICGKRRPRGNFALQNREQYLKPVMALRHLHSLRTPFPGLQILYGYPFPTTKTHLQPAMLCLPLHPSLLHHCHPCWSQTEYDKRPTAVLLQGHTGVPHFCTVLPSESKPDHSSQFKASLEIEVQGHLPQRMRTEKEDNEVGVKEREFWWCESLRYPKWP